MEIKINDLLDQVNKVTNELKDSKLSIEDALIKFKQAKKLIEEAETKLKEIDEEVLNIFKD